MAARDLVSKLLAAGLSAGVFLLWWPEHHPTTGLVSLVVRGALWTLSFELLLLAFAPLERQVRLAVGGRIAFRRSLEVRIGGACALACAGAALPVMLLAGSHAPQPARAAAATRPKPQRVVVVRRQKVVVRREVVTVPLASAAAEHPAPVSPVVVKKVAVPARTKRAAAKKVTTTTKQPTAVSAAPTKTTAATAPAPTSTAPATTAPAADVATP